MSDSITSLLNRLDDATKTKTSSELKVMHMQGDLPSGIYSWLIALRKADIAIPSKNPRTM